MGRLSDYGAGTVLDVQSFPDCVDPEFLDAWASYVTTQTAQDLFNSAPQPLGMIRAVQGFLSSLSTISTKFLLRAVPGFKSDSIKLARSLIHAQRKELNLWLTRIRFTEQLSLAEVKTTIDSSYNVVANCMSSTMNIYLVFVPKPVKGKIPKIGKVLHEQIPYWFSGKQPPALFKTDNLTKKLDKGGAVVTPDTYQPLQNLMHRPRAWYEWNTKLGIASARIRGNAVALHIQSPRLLMFLGTHKKSEMERKLNRLVNEIYV
ncbi:hypothetical protein fHeYen902_072c [Yersinia phage fHe-Yen9-02]|nr:hypothetical protein fHeYen902_072c [Yersinia phage fHe-Yen9-02]